MSAEDEIKKLRLELQRHNKLYHQDDNPEISDAEYDALYTRLKELEKLTGTLDLSSPTTTVGAKPKRGFEKHAHVKPMLSLSNVFNSDMGLCGRTGAVLTVLAPPVDQAGGMEAHGGNLEATARRLGCRPDQILDASASLAPFALPRAARRALRQVDLRAYPDRSHLRLRQQRWKSTRLNSSH